MSAQTQPTTEQNVPTFQGTLGTGFAAVCSSSFYTSLQAMYEIVQAFYNVKSLTIQNILSAAQEQAKFIEEKGALQRWNYIGQGIIQGATAGSMGFQSMRGSSNELEAQTKIKNIQESNNALNLKAFSEHSIDGDVTNAKSLAFGMNPENMTPEEKNLFRNYAAPNEKDLIKDKLIKLSPDAAFDGKRSAYQELLQEPVGFSEKTFNEILSGDEDFHRDPDTIDSFKRTASPDQRQRIIDKSKQFEDGEHPEIKQIRSKSERDFGEIQLQSRGCEALLGGVSSTVQAAFAPMITKEDADANLAQGAEQGLNQSAGIITSCIESIVKLVETLVGALTAIGQAAAR